MLPLDTTELAHARSKVVELSSQLRPFTVSHFVSFAADRPLKSRPCRWKEYKLRRAICGSLALTPPALATTHLAQSFTARLLWEDSEKELVENQKNLLPPLSGKGCRRIV